MGGFVGCVFDEPQNNHDIGQTLAEKMNHVIAHRGSDDEGYYIDQHVILGFRQLTTNHVEDVHQPFVYADGRYTIVLDGNIINHAELQEKLRKDDFRLEHNSPAETIAALYSSLGEKLVERLRGVFAFVIWDKQKQTMFAARDHFGSKPFFYSLKKDRIYFASEKKSILSVQKNKGYLNYESLQHYFTFQFVPEPNTMDEGIQKLEPGHFFIKKIGLPIEKRQYWKAGFHPVHKSEDEFVREIRDVLFESVERHMRLNIATGSFLSGGIDSSFIASIAKEFNPNLITFSVGFARNGYNEIDVAQETAEKIGVKNISYIISPDEYMSELPKIMWMMDDPLADPACVPLYFAAREAKRHVSAVLSGEGADELFGGYNIYREPQSLQIFQKMPRFLKGFLRMLAGIIPEGMKGKSFIERGTTPLEERYIGNAKMFSEKEKQELLIVYNDQVSYKNITEKYYKEARAYGPVETMQYIDLHTWMRGDILLKADRSTMAHSLELLSPFLDKEVFNVASKIPAKLKTGNGTTKYILRQAAKGIVPDHVLNRKKLGFPVPIRHWLKNEMHDWAKKLIHESNTDHLINKNYVLKMFEEHCRGKRDYSRKIWTVLMFMVWHQVYVEDKYLFGKEKAASKEKVFAQ